MKLNFKSFLQKYPYINEFKYPILAGSVSGSIINYIYSDYTYQKQYPNKVIPNKVLIVPAIKGAIIGGIVWPIPIFLFSISSIVVIDEEYKKWVEKQINNKE